MSKVIENDAIEYAQIKKRCRRAESACDILNCVIDDLKTENRKLKEHLNSLALINACLMDTITDDQKKVVSKKIKIKEGKKHGKTKKAK